MLLPEPRLSFDLYSTNFSRRLSLTLVKNSILSLELSQVEIINQLSFFLFSSCIFLSLDSSSALEFLSCMFSNLMLISRCVASLLADSSSLILDLCFSMEMQLMCSSRDCIMLRRDCSSCKSLLCLLASPNDYCKEQIVSFRLYISLPYCCSRYIRVFFSYQTRSSLCCAYLSKKFSSLSLNCSLRSLKSCCSCQFCLSRQFTFSQFLRTFSLSSSRIALRLLFSAYKFWFKNSNLSNSCLQQATSELSSLVSSQKVVQSLMICMSSICAVLGSCKTDWIKSSLLGQRMQTMKTR